VNTGEFEIRVDEPESAGGSNTGPQPTEVFLASLASCFALAIAHVARKREVELPDLAVKATGTYDGPKFVNIRLDVTSSHNDREELASCVERASSVCYVSNTLRVLDDTEVVVGDDSAQP
jgi:putative redox protein